MAKQTRQEAIAEAALGWPVIVDGNRKREKIPYSIAMSKDRGCTLKRCAEMVAMLESRFGVQIDQLTIFLTEWDYESISDADFEASQYGDFSVQPKKGGGYKEARYWVAANRLMIWKNGMPIYENENGTICKDEVALADTYC